MCRSGFSSVQTPTPSKFTGNRPCAFFSMFLVTFFSPNLRGRAKKRTKCPKKKKTLAQCPRLPDRQMTNRTNCVERSYSFVYFFTKQWSWFQSPRKFNFSWYLTSLRGQRTCSNLQLKRSSTLQMHSSCRDRSLDGKLDRGLDSRQNTYPDVFVKARPHYYQQSLHSMISTERILAFGFQWQDSVTRLLPPVSRKRVLRCFQSFGECAWMASIMLFRIMVWDVHPIIYLHPTMEKEKVLLPPRNNREEIATSTHIESASATCKCCAHDTDGQ